VAKYGGGDVAKYQNGQGWLLRNGERIAPVEIAASLWARARGLLGRDGIEGAILLTPCSSIHTLGMRFGIDVAYLTKDLRIISTAQVPPNRLCMVRLRSRHVLEAELGKFTEWGIRPDGRLEIETISSARVNADQAPK
jgi:uncharacterized protein